MIEHEFVRTWGWLLALVTNGLLLWAGWTLCKKFVTREDFTAHLAAEESQKAATRDHLAEHDIAVNALTDKINAMPGKDAIHVLDVKLVSIQGELTRTNEALRGLRDIMHRVENQSELLYRDRLEGKG